MSEAKPMQPTVEQHGTFMSYLTGFLISIFLTIYAYIAVVHRSFSGKKLMVWLLCLAVVQFFVQIFYFLHVGREAKPRFKLLLLFFMILVVLIVVLGSIWIMYNLNYRMTQDQINHYLQSQDGGI